MIRPASGIRPASVGIGRSWVCTVVSRRNIEAIEARSVRPALEAVLESVRADGTPYLDHADGRLENPGHAIEGAWSMMQQGIDRQGKSLVDLGLQIADESRMPWTAMSARERGRYSSEPWSATWTPSSRNTLTEQIRVAGSKWFEPATCRPGPS